MRARGFILILLVICAGLGISISLRYTPPLLRTGGAAIGEAAVDFIGFVWHHNRAFWYEALGKRKEANCELLRSAWYRPDFFKEYVQNPGDLYEIADKLESCGYHRFAAQTYEKAVRGRNPGPHDWARLGRLRLAAADYRDAVANLERAAEGALSPEIFEDLAYAYEKSGKRDTALKWYRKALGSDAGRFRSLLGLSRLATTEEERELARKMAESLVTNEVHAVDMKATTGDAVPDGWALWGNGALGTEVNLLAGRATIAVVARGRFAGSEWPIMRLLLDSTELAKFAVSSESWQTHELQITVERAGRYSLEIEFINDYFDEETGRDRNLYVNKVLLTWSQ